MEQQEQYHVESAIIPDIQEGTHFFDENLADRKASRYIFFAGDVVEQSSKYEFPDRAFGGIVLDRFHTLKSEHNAAGMVYRCKITPLRTALCASSPDMLDPSSLKNSQQYKKSYTFVRPHDGAEPQRVIDGLVRWEIYPGDEIGGITTPHLPFGVGGVTELKSLKGQPEEAARMAQYAFFPDWDEISSGLKRLPTTLRELEDQLRERREEIEDPLLRMIGNDMLQACSRYRQWGLNYLKYQTAMVKASSPEVPRVYSDLAEQLFQQLERKRDDAILNDFESITAKIAEATGNQNLNTAEALKMIAESVKLQTEMFMEMQAKQAEPAKQTKAKTTKKAKAAKKEEPEEPEEVAVAPMIGSEVE